ncbi:MAG TPA: ECF-type sigma factor [Pyrinomonadaceae bacterium]|nr:ECF-type sigma factor [Pyrinomonadaceae bacterium]
MPEITDLLKDWNEGDDAAFDRVIPLVDEELKKIARGYMCKEKRERLLQTTDLVQEALMRLIKKNVTWENRRQFYAIVARRMRQVLIYYAKKRPQAERADIADVLIPDEQRSKEIILLDEALRKFEKLYKRPAKVVEYRYFTGWTVKKIAEQLRVSPKTVERDWESARAWLKREMTGELVMK